ncbi:hypothetical protein HZH66_007075 [Vespula vulgaris]|uniref:F-box domain-containing protein n=1 Tax=Vespula vulgaris TaxID=7454 RepID=A0A834N6L8_VESVU|nr:hypothetical protein HZH66_007075 [Vespula vulgaris]
MGQWRKRRIDVQQNGNTRRMDKVAINEEENVGKRAKVIRHCGFSSSSFLSSSPYNNNKPANIESIPVELILQILSYLSQKDLSNMSRVSKYFEGIMQDPIVWRTYEVANIPYENISKIIEKLRNMPFLKKLTINYREDSDKILRQISLTNKNLEKLYVYFCKGSPSKLHLHSRYLNRILEKCRRLNTIKILGSSFYGRKFYKLLGDIGLRLKSASLPATHSQFTTFIKHARQICDNDRLNDCVNAHVFLWQKRAQLYYYRKATRRIKMLYLSENPISINITEDGKWIYTASEKYS